MTKMLSATKLIAASAAVGLSVSVLFELDVGQIQDVLAKAGMSANYSLHIGDSDALNTPKIPGKEDSDSVSGEVEDANADNMIVDGQDAAPVDDLESAKMWDRDNKELHCEDRDLIHPCTKELTKYLKDGDEAFGDTSYDCAKKVFDTKNDFYVVKNMTHLLLDLDTANHYFDRNDNRDNRFYKLGLDFGRKLLYHDDCVGEFDTKGTLECRCPMLYGKILMLKLKNAGRWDDARALYDELKEFEWNGKQRQYAKGEAFPWVDFQQTPQIVIPGLYAEPVWGEDRRKDLPIWDTLEDNYKMIRNEIEAVYDHDGAWEDSYRFLFKEVNAQIRGNWNQILLYHGRNYTEACEKLMPKTCAILKESLPKREVHHYPWTSNQNEQVLVLRIKKGTDVEVHSGPANNILNVHLGISGLEGAVLGIANKTYSWEEGKVIAWDGSYDHLVECKNCQSEWRTIMMVRYMHPDVTKEHYRGNTKTHYEDVPADWFPEDKLERREEL